MPQSDPFAAYVVKSAPAASSDDPFAAYVVGANASAPAAPAKSSFFGPYQGAADIVGDLAVGAAKGLGSTALGLGRAVQAIPGVKSAIDYAYGTPGISDTSFKEADTAVTPSNTTQKVGKFGEQVAEVLAPSKALTAAGTTLAAKVAPKLAGMLGTTAAELAPRVAVEAAGNAGMSAAQGGDPLTGAVLGSAAPVAGRFGDQMAEALRSSATKNVLEALGPTKEHFKALGEKLAPEILKRGIRGSREAIAEQAGAAAESAGQDIDAALKAFGARQVGVQPVVDALKNAKDAFRTTNAAGQAVVFEPRAVKQLDGLQQIVSDLGPDARVDQLVALRRSWDKVVADAGGFSHRAPGGIGRPLKDISEAANKREATTAIRQLLNQDVPELTALNKEFAFWKNLDDVVTQTLQRKQPQAASLAGAVKEAGGMAAGAAIGGGVGTAVGLGKVAKYADAVFQSPRWKLASAQMKDALAEAITSGNSSAIMGALARVMATQASKLPAALGEGPK
ncbi:MAG TPA: hypothetical protein VGJ78_04390 [Vicinamibacterales bacterium]|jgi:hypothetical protein